MAQDYVQASEWYFKASAQGSVDAMYYLGSLHDEVAHDYADAAIWYRQAAEKGHVGAQHRLRVSVLVGARRAAGPCHGFLLGRCCSIQHARRGSQKGRNRTRLAKRGFPDAVFFSQCGRALSTCELSKDLGILAYARVGVGISIQAHFGAFMATKIRIRQTGRAPHTTAAAMLP